jgi:hypothetical protein
VRDLQLLSATHDLDPGLVSIGEVSDLLAVFAPLRRGTRRAVEQAQAQGLAELDVTVDLPFSAAREAARLHELLAISDEGLAGEQLLTVRADPDVVRLRAWLIEQVQAQLEEGAEAVAWADWAPRDPGSPPPQA